jgi:hypothetical protein
MKTRQSCVGRLLLAALVTVCAVCQANRAYAQVDVSFNVNIQSPSDFYDPLGHYGAWVNVSQYGRCWRPTVRASDWRPYTTGHWEWTDAGWYWVSDEPWAWACYHYGQWVVDPVNGWVWLPGTQWAPAWVTWREAPDYIGWAPCGPGGVVFSTTPFFFVDIHHFHDRLQPREFVFNDPRILGRSRVVGGFQTETRDWGGAQRRIAFNKGPDLAPIERATGSRFTQRPVREIARQTAPPATVGRTPGAFTQQPVTPNRQHVAAPDESANSSHIYHEPQAAPPTPTGRQEPRLYHEAPKQPPTPPSAAPPTEVPRPSQEVPREAPNITPPQQARRAGSKSGTQPGLRTQAHGAPVTKGSDVTPPQRALPPTGFERGQPPVEVPRRPEQSPRAADPATPQPQAPRAVPAPTAPPASGTAPKDEGRKRDRDGQ